MNEGINSFMEGLKARTPGELEFHQAVLEVVESVWEVYDSNPRYKQAKILERMVEPERTIMFRVPWTNDKGEVEINRGYRVEFNSALGPYKGGLRFHRSVTLSILKFLGFEQTFKNSLTTLPMGGGKGGSDFSAKGRSDNEIMRFCQSFMTELFRHIGPNTDVPAGDIGVGGREIGFLFGQYKRIRNEFTGVLTGKGLGWGGSLIRPEATGFGAVYFVEHMLKKMGKEVKGKTFSVSGFGNVAWGAITKINELGGKVITISGPDGYIYDPDGVTGEKVDYLLELRDSNNDVVAPYAEEFGVEFFPDQKPWETCMTLCRQWSWKPDDRMKTLKVCLQTLARCAGGDEQLSADLAVALEDGHLVATSGGDPRRLEPAGSAVLRTWVKRRESSEDGAFFVEEGEEVTLHSPAASK